MKRQRAVHVIVKRGETHYIAECVELPVVTQGKTLDETLYNLQEAVSLHLEGEDLEELGLSPSPLLVVTLELDLPAHVSQA